MGSAFRLKVATLSACGDNFVSVGAWQASSDRSGCTPGDVVVSLQQTIKQRFAATFDRQDVKVFYACFPEGAKQAERDLKLQAAQHRGIVIVPRSEDDLFMEKPHSMLYVAEPLPAEVANFDGFRPALSRGGEETLKAVQDILMPAAARFVLTPTAQERREMQADFEKLGIRQPLEALEIPKGAKGRLKESFRSWLGPSTLRQDELARLLREIDPSWTGEELNVLMGGARGIQGDCVASDEFIDWVFSFGQEGC